MVSSTVVVIGIVVAIVLIIVIAAVVIFVSSRNKSSGATGATGCSNTCTVLPLGCSSTNVLVVGFTGANCSAACKGSTGTATVTGCAAPICNSPYCTPGQAQYSTVSGNNNVIQKCSTGGTGTALIPNNCTDNSTNGVFLSGLGVQSSNISANQIFPIFITTIGNSIYQNGPVTNVPSGIDPVSLKGSTDQTVVNDPYLLYWNSASTVMTFKRLSDIKANFNINNAIWVYDNHVSQLFPFEFLGSTGPGVGGNTAVINNPTFNGALFVDGNYNYYGPNPPCSYNTYTPNFLECANNVVYNGNIGAFNFQQQNLPGTGYILTSGIMRGTNSSYEYPTGTHNDLVVAGSDYQLPINFGGICNITDFSRWYSINANNIYL